MNVHGMELLLTIENTEGATFWSRSSKRNSRGTAFKADPLNHLSGILHVYKRTVALASILIDLFRRRLVSNRH
jgi:hypothetical protein